MTLEAIVEELEAIEREIHGPDSAYGKRDTITESGRWRLIELRMRLDRETLTVRTAGQAR
jgi:hypothetical protein